jgi:hypothetical protein
MKKIVLFVAAMSFAAFSFFINAESTHAQGDVGIKISPTRYEELVDPGQVLQREITVANESGTDKQMFVYLRDFRAEDETGEPTLIAPGTGDSSSLASWLQITTDAIDFKAGEEKTIPFSINVPKSAGPGGYYGAIYLGTEPPRINVNSADKGAGMAIAQQAGSLILLQIKGAADERAEIREFNTEKDLFGTPFDIKFITRIENLGNVHVKPNGLISIKNMLGREVASIRVNEKGGNVLPASIRRFDVSWQGKMGFGRYVASLGVTYGTPVDKGGQGMQSLYTEKYFWIVPWKIIIPVLLSLIILVSLFVLFLKLYKNKAVRKAMEQAGFRNVKYMKQQKGPSPAMHFSLVLLSILIILFLLITAVYFLFFA